MYKQSTAVLTLFLGSAAAYKLNEVNIGGDSGYEIGQASRGLFEGVEPISRAPTQIGSSVLEAALEWGDATTNPRDVLAGKAHPADFTPADVPPMIERTKEEKEDIVEKKKEDAKDKKENEEFVEDLEKKAEQLGAME